MSKSIGWCVALITTTLDLWTKWKWFGVERVLAPHVFSISAHKNFGLLFDLSARWEAIVGVTVAVLLIAVFFAIQKTASMPPRVAFGLWLIIGGGFGNLFDRLWFHYVRDWMLLFERSAFNFADMFVLGGLVMIVMASTREPSTT